MKAAKNSTMLQHGENKNSLITQPASAGFKTSNHVTFLR